MGIEVAMITETTNVLQMRLLNKWGSIVYYEVLPEDKADEVIKLQKEGKKVMVGDGIHDAPALARLYWYCDWFRYRCCHGIRRHCLNA